MLNCACYRQTEPPKTLEKPTKNDKILRCTPDCLFMCAQSKKHEKPRGFMFGIPKNTGLRISVDRWKWTVEKSTTKTDPVCCFGIRESAQIWTPWQCDTISNSKPPPPRFGWTHDFHNLTSFNVACFVIYHKFHDVSRHDVSRIPEQKLLFFLFLASWYIIRDTSYVIHHEIWSI